MKINLNILLYLIVSFLLNGWMQISTFQEYNEAKVKFKFYSEYKGIVTNLDCHNHGYYQVNAIFKDSEKIYGTKFVEGKNNCAFLNNGQVVPIWISNIDKDVATFVEPKELVRATLFEFWVGWIGLPLFFGAMILFYELKFKGYHLLVFSRNSIRIEKSNKKFIYKK